MAVEVLAEDKEAWERNTGKHLTAIVSILFIAIIIIMYFRLIFNLTYRRMITRMV